MSDLISRQDAIRAIKSDMDGYSDKMSDVIRDGIIYTLNSLQSRSVPDWIPVTEALPKECEKVLCMGSKGGWYISEIFIVRGVPEWHMSSSQQRPKPVAWMPLPEPYKEEKHEN